MINNDDFGGFLVTNSVLLGDVKPMYTYREKMVNKVLNGWHIMGMTDDEEYINNSSNWSIVNAETVLKVCPVLLEYFDADYGTDIAFTYKGEGVIIGLVDLNTLNDTTIEEINMKKYY